MLRKAKTVMVPKTGKPGKIQLNCNCDLSVVLEIISRLGFVQSRYSELTPEIAGGVDNIVISISPEDKVPHPKNNKPAFPGYSSSGKTVHVVDTGMLPMLMEIAVSLPKRKVA